MNRLFKYAATLASLAVLYGVAPLSSSDQASAPPSSDISKVAIEKRLSSIMQVADIGKLRDRFNARARELTRGDYVALTSQIKYTSISDSQALHAWLLKNGIKKKDGTEGGDFLVLLQQHIDTSNISSPPTHESPAELRNLRGFFNSIKLQQLPETVETVTFDIDKVAIGKRLPALMHVADIGKLRDRFNARARDLTRGDYVALTSQIRYTSISDSQALHAWLLNNGIKIKDGTEGGDFLVLLQQHIDSGNISSPPTHESQAELRNLRGFFNSVQ